tara:strand:- start:86 stop:991 length:906 start_codon:yes stop_codon:yes gene_type:complete
MSIVFKVIIIGLIVSLFFGVLVIMLLGSNEINPTLSKGAAQLEISEIVFHKKTGVAGDEIGQFDRPYSLEFFDNQLFVLDSGNNRIQIFSKNLDFKMEINLPDDQKHLPQGIAVTSDKIFVAYTYDYVVKSFDYNGNTLNKFPVSWTTDLEADEDFIYVMEPHKSSVQVYDHQGVLIKQFKAHKNLHYINSNQKNLVVSGPHPSVNIPPDILIYDKNSGMVEKRFSTSGAVNGSAITEDIVLFLELDSIKIVNFDGELFYEFDLEKGIGDVRHSKIEINGNFVYLADFKDNSIKILEIIYQ